MKRVFCLAFMICMLISSVVSAECNLDTTRWRWVASDSKVGVFYDSLTIDKLNNNLLECWTCFYYPNGCDVHNYEHYHYDMAHIDFYNKLYGIKFYIILLQ